MGESKRHKYKLRLGVVTTVLLVVLIVYFAAQMFGKMNTSISVINTQYVTDKSFLSLNGYVYRNEEIITAPAGEIADFLVADGEKIPVGKEYMTLYKTNISDEIEIRNAQDQIRLLSEKMDLLKDELGDNIRVQDITPIKAAFDSSYYSFVSSVAHGIYSSADSDGEDMLDALNKQQMIAGKLDSIKSSVDAIIKEKQDIIDKHATDSGRIYRNDRSCYFFGDVDGYEAAFSYGDVMTMSADEFRAKTTELKKAGLEGAVGKRVYDSKWYLVVPIHHASLTAFNVGELYDIYLSEIGDDSIPMNCERVEIGQNGISGFAVLSSNEIGKSFEVSRYTSIKILRSSVSGYRVPDEAIYSVDTDDDGYNDYTGVYVMSGNYVKFRRIDIASYGVGYVIVKDSDGIEQAQFPYLSGNELIIVSGGNLYDGKLIK